jgi:hypothetical protein
MPMHGTKISLLSRPGGVVWYVSVVAAILLEWLFSSVIKEPKAA